MPAWPRWFFGSARKRGSMAASSEHGIPSDGQEANRDRHGAPRRLQNGQKRSCYLMVGVFTLSTLLAGGCAIPLDNLTASLGGSTAAARGTVRVLFINNTPHRAVFTYGTFDQTDQFSQS